jgi:hypothetical protein
MGKRTCEKRRRAAGHLLNPAEKSAKCELSSRAPESGGPLVSRGFAALAAQDVPKLD